MSEVELLLINESENCTIYTIRFLSEDESEFEKFYSKFKDDMEYSSDLMRIIAFIDKIAERGALERFFRQEGKFNDSICALPVVQAKLRLYCLRLSNKILVLGNGGVKKSRTYNEDDTLRGYVITLQKFEKFIRDSEKNGTIEVTTHTIEINKTFHI